MFHCFVSVGWVTEWALACKCCAPAVLINLIFAGLTLETGHLQNQEKQQQCHTTSNDWGLLLAVLLNCILQFVFEFSHPACRKSHFCARVSINLNSGKTSMMMNVEIEWWNNNGEYYYCLIVEFIAVCSKLQI